MRLNYTFLFLCIVLIRVSAGAQNILNDMPRKTIAVNTIPKKWLQVETGIGAKANKRSSEKRIFFDHPFLQTRYGLTKKIELRFNTAFLSSYYEFWNSIETRKQTLTGWNNIQIGGKVKLLQDFKNFPDISLTAHYRINNKNWRGRNGPVTDTINGGNFRFSFQNSFSNNFRLDYSTGIDWISWKSNERFVYTLSPAFHFNKKWSGYLEASGILWKEYSPLHFIRAGAGFSPAEHYAFDVIIGKCWNQKERYRIETFPTGEIALQFSWRFNCASK